MGLDFNADTLYYCWDVINYSKTLCVREGCEIIPQIAALSAKSDDGIWPLKPTWWKEKNLILKYCARHNPTNVCVCACVCMHMCTHAHRPAHLYICEQIGCAMLWCKNKTLGIFCSCLLNFFETGSFTEPEACHWTLMTVRQLQGSTGLHTQYWGFKYMHSS